ncbi:MAG: hypothetical protein JWP38_1455 [Herbaspirillum sp.]|nr:hypothetical protein [Herbaspirillum sp.]
MDSGTNNGVSRCGPRRLANSICTPPATGAMRKRKGADDACCAQDSGRIMQNSAAPLCAAKCSRRSAAWRMWLCQHSKAPQLSARNICSAAHRVSASRPGAIHSSCDGASPSAANPSACGGCGGCSRTMRRCFKLRSAGCSKRNSPMPSCCSKSSIRLPIGQPPPGNSADSSAWPVSMQRVAPRASCDARQSDGCIVSGEWASAVCIKSCQCTV